MTSQEILGADVLDILFEKRNKDYGAYALRRTYKTRLILSLGAVLSIVSIFLLLMSFRKKDHSPVPQVIIGPVIELQPIKPLKPLEPKETIQKPKLENLATAKDVSRIVIRPEINRELQMLKVSDLTDKVISVMNHEGPLTSDIAKPVLTNIAGNAEGNQNITQSIEILERQPEFPGGPEALRKWLADNLTTPEDLEIGEKKMVRIKFTVGAEGLITNLEIINSGGSVFDREVIRVCKKMPKWKPAIQNGVSVSVSYVLPVTFIGVEE